MNVRKNSRVPAAHAHTAGVHVGGPPCPAHLCRFWNSLERERGVNARKSAQVPAAHARTAGAGDHLGGPASALPGPDGTACPSPEDSLCPAEPARRRVNVGRPLERLVEAAGPLTATGGGSEEVA